MTKSVPVTCFYGHTLDCGEKRVFSNFFDQSQAPFIFEVPEQFFTFGVTREDRMVRCCVSEMAIMVCKAAMMGDERSYFTMRDSTDKLTPSKIKMLGRKVKKFNKSLWIRWVCSVAFQVVYQKFSKSPALQPTLLKTGDVILAEATQKDCNWGIGIDMGHPNTQIPSQWKGTNILGWALMEARNVLRTEPCQIGSTSMPTKSLSNVADGRKGKRGKRKRGIDEVAGSSTMPSKQHRKPK